MFTRVFKCLEHILKDLKMIRAEQLSIKGQLAELLNKEAGEKISFGLPDDISIPVETDDELLHLNLQLKEDNSWTAALAHYLHAVAHGKTMGSYLLSITRLVLSKDVAKLYSRLGRKGKKRFKDIDAVYRAILAGASLKFKEALTEELADKFGRVLASAIDWDGAGSKKNFNILDLSLQSSLDLSREL